MHRAARQRVPVPPDGGNPGDVVKSPGGPTASTAMVPLPPITGRGDVVRAAATARSAAIVPRAPTLPVGSVTIVRRPPPSPIGATAKADRAIAAGSRHNRLLAPPTAGSGEDRQVVAEEDDAAGAANLTIAAAKARGQLYDICVELAAQSGRAVRVVVEGEPEWCISSEEALVACGTGGPSDGHLAALAHEGVGDTSWGMTDGELQALTEALADSDVRAVARRAKVAFKKTRKAFAARLDAERRRADEAQTQRMSMESGGSRFTALQAELEANRTQVKLLTAKTKALLTLLDRAGAAVKVQDEQQQRLRQQLRQKEAERLEWGPMRALLPELIIDGRRDDAVLRDVHVEVGRIVERLCELDAAADLYAERYAECDARCDTVGRDKDALAVRFRLLEAAHSNVKSDLATAAVELQGAQSELESNKVRFERERLRLVRLVEDAEAAVRRAVEVKPTIPGRGRGTDVPVFLRYEGDVSHNAMLKREVEDLINTIWTARGPSLQAREREIEQAVAAGPVVFVDYGNVADMPNPVGDFPSFVAHFLINRTTKRRPRGKSVSGGAHTLPSVMPQATAELAYALMEGCDKFRYDADVELFRRIAIGELPERVYHDQMIMFAKLRAALLQEGSIRFGSTSALSVGVLMEVVRGFFPWKSDDDVAFLRLALIQDAVSLEDQHEEGVGDGTWLNIADLLESNEFGNQRAFIEAVRDQHIEDAGAYTAELCAAMRATPLVSADEIAVERGIGGAAEAAAGTESTRLTRVATLREVVARIDPTKPAEDVDAFIADALASPFLPDVMALVDPVRAAARSRLCFTKRFGKAVAAAEIDQGPAPVVDTGTCPPAQDRVEQVGEVKEPQVAAVPLQQRTTGSDTVEDNSTLSPPRANDSDE